ncbi:polysaccharide pyruvyl transferase family protein [Aestuariibius sp. 2305UL40-4]|uniref:polysaccharide pyruvyl transferase family protein n=1 Tax=Aestuariibius violaceus TaxID=3234132 RepID=UPI00345EFAB7
MRHIHLIDTSIASDNLGDEIIVEECRPYIKTLFPEAYITTSSGHDGLGPWGRQLVEKAEIAFLLGTNALAPHDQTKRRFIWTIREEDRPVLKNKVVLFGVGANRDFDKVLRVQRKLLAQVLSSRYAHAVRDSSGGRIVAASGRKAINTTCPTLWRYADYSPSVPAEKPDTVCFTLTKHKSDPLDAEMVAILKDTYQKLTFWPQQPRDLDYLRELTDLSGITVLPASLGAYDAYLESTSTDVVGTRLHGCIRGLKHGHRVLAISIDNRAREIGAETGLPTLARDDIPAQLVERLASQSRPSLRIPSASINQFLSQF